MERDGIRCVLAIDIGTSSVRALGFDRHAAKVPGLEVHLPYQPRVSMDGTAEVDAARLVRLVIRAVTELTARMRERGGSFQAVGTSCFWHGLLAADEHGRALTPVYLWSDSRSWGAAEQLQAAIDGEALRQRTGCLVHPTYWPAKLKWLREARAELRNPGVRWLSFSDLLFWKLFGKPVTSLSMASGTGLLNLRDREWDGEILDELGLARDSLPRLGDRACGLTAGFARRWPGLADIPWFTAVGDGALANLGSGCTGTEERGLTVGTSGALRVMVRGKVPRVPPGLWCYRLDEDRLVVGGALNNGGNLYAWLTHTLALEEGALERRIRKLAPGAHGLTFLPLLAGERSPGFASHATGAIAGLTQATTAEEIARAGLEAVALQFALVSERIDQMAPRPRRLVASGGGLLHSPAWMQMMADAIGIPVAASRVAEASSRGAAIYALEKLEALDGASLRIQVGRTYRPNPATKEAYRQQRDRQQILYEVLVRERRLDGDRPQTQTAHLQARF